MPDNPRQRRTERPSRRRRGNRPAEELIAGGGVSLGELEEKARQNWRLTAEEALERA